jgi:hypothetical protein
MPGALVILCTPTLSPAETARAAELRYVRDTSASSCADEKEFRSKVSARLGYMPFREHAALVLTVHLAQADLGFKAAVRYEDATAHANSTRKFSSTATDCAELIESIALAVSIVLDPLERKRSLPPASNSSVGLSSPLADDAAPPVALLHAPIATPNRTPTSTADDPAPETSSEQAVTKSGNQPAAVETTFGSLAAVAAAPSPSVGFTMGLGLKWMRASVALEGRLDLPASSPDFGGRRVQSSLLVGALVPCFRPGPIWLCTVFGAGSLRGTGEGAATTFNEMTFYATAGPRAGVEWAPSSAFALVAHADLLAVLTRTELRINGVPLWTTPPVTAGIGLRIVGRFR